MDMGQFWGKMTEKNVRDLIKNIDMVASWLSVFFSINVGHIIVNSRWPLMNEFIEI